MKILITGGAGFIGSAVVRRAIAVGYDVVNVDCLTYAGNLEAVRSVCGNSNYQFENVDIRNQSTLLTVFEKHKPDAVIHLAAETHVDRSINTPKQFIETNVLGTYNMLECASSILQDKGTKQTFRFIHVSTDEVFGSLTLDTSDRFTEESQYKPNSPYSASKASSDHFVRAWTETYGFPAIITNCSNNYGPFQNPEKLIPLVITRALKNQTIPIYGDGKNVRDWLYVDDHADALLTILSKGRIGQSYNIGGNNEFSNLEVVETICDHLETANPVHKQKYKSLIKFVEDRPGHDRRYAIDATKLKAEINWCTKTAFPDGIKATIDWYLSNKT